MVLPVNEYLFAIIITQLSIRFPLLGGTKRGAANMRIPFSGRRYQAQTKKGVFPGNPGNTPFESKNF